MSAIIAQLAVQYAPVLVAILGFVITIAKVVGEFKKLKREVVDMRQVRTLNDRLDQVIQENQALRKQISELLTKIDRIKRN